MTELKRTPIFDVYKNMVEKQLILVAGSFLSNFQVLKKNMKQFEQKQACLMFLIWEKLLSKEKEV